MSGTGAKWLPLPVSRAEPRRLVSRAPPRAALSCNHQQMLELVLCYSYVPQVCLLQISGCRMILYVVTWLQLAADRRAVTALEYGLIAGIVVAIVTVGFRLMANSLSSKFVSIGGSL